MATDDKAQQVRQPPVFFGCVVVLPLDRNLTLAHLRSRVHGRVAALGRADVHFEARVGEDVVRGSSFLQPVACEECAVVAMKPGSTV